MSLLSGILQSQAPPKQDATSTIQTLCLRLSSGTLLEDRRAAIMGLRSFARDYKELVASEGLRGLIATLDKDREDLDTVKAVLETLLTLFVKDESNPESSEDIALWLTDEFTQKQENITLLIDLLEDGDFYIRLYTLQLLAAILQNRPARTQECVLTAPHGITRLVSILDDKRDAIRNEVILLIIHLTSGHTDIQKLVAFENAFDRIFSIIDLEGGVEGGIVSQDCLQLLINLLEFNVSNQNYFRETGGVLKLAKQLDLKEEEVLPFAKQQRDTNIQYTIRVVRLFVVPGGLGTSANQNALATAGILHLVLRVAFSPSCDLAVRAEALKAVADLIDGNAPLQQGFAQMQVTPPEAQSPTTNGEPTEPVEYFVIEALLELGLLNSSIQAFDARLAACRCLQAYFNGNPPVKEHFLAHAIGLHADGDESANILTCLFNLDNESRGDPYRVWIATVVLIHLIYGDNEVKALATSVKEGDAEAGEEEVTAIQTVSANLIAALQHHYDPRICVGYLMLLCIWLYEDSDAVDDFLSEGGCVQSLVGTVKENGTDPTVQGLAAFLLGILYEFSHKDSPVPRATLHPILSSRMGRDHYVSKITKLRSNPLIRDFEVNNEESMPGFHRRIHGLPEVYFDRIFVEFFKDSYSQILRAIDKDPGQETRVASNGVIKVSNGVSLELMDSLKAQLEDKEAALSKIENARLTLEQQISREHHEAQRAREAAATEIRKTREAMEAQRKRYESEAATKEEKNRALIEEITKRNRRGMEERDGQITAWKRQVDDLTRQSKTAQSDANTLRRQLDDLERKSKATIDEKEYQLQGVRRQIEDLARKTKNAIMDKDSQIQSLQQQLDETRRAADQSDKASQSRVAELEQAAQAKLAEAEATLKAQLQDQEKRLKETASWELEAVQTRLGEVQAELDAAAAKHAQELKEVRAQHVDVEKRADAAEAAAAAAAADAKAARDETEAKVKSAKDEAEAKIAAGKDEADAKIAAASAESEASLKALEAKLKAADEKAAKAAADTAEAEQAAKDSQAELEDLLMVMGDLEEKRKADKAKLRELGAEVSDDDEDDDDDEDEEEEEEEE
ncbi:p115 like vesicle tethering protein [Geopyxis carbonaria]|nr:p115 like vesicle tethering protein [Geopyxis carbonaria]